MTSLRRKLLLQFLIITLVGLLAVTALNYFQAKSIVEEEIQVQAERYVEGKANEIDLWLAARVSEIEAYAQIPAIKSMDWERQQQWYLKSEAQRLSSIYEILFVTDTEGNFETTLDAKGSVRERDYFPVVMSGKTAISDPVISNSTGEPIIVVATPIKNDAGQIVGVMAGTVHMETFNNIVSGITLGRTGYGYAVNGQGMMLAGPNRDDVLNRNILEDPNESLRDVGQRMVAGEHGHDIYSLDGSERFVCFAPVKSTGWGLAVAVPYGELTESVGALLTKSIIAAVIVLAIMAVIIWVVANRLTKPVIMLSQIAETVAAGDLTQEVELNSNDEIGQLAGSFNKMVQNLRALVRRINDISITLSSSAQELSVSSEETGKATEQVAATIGELARGAGEQADAVDKSNRMMVEIAATINQVATNAGNVAQVASQASEMSEVGIKTLDNLNQSIEQSTQSFSSVANALDVLINDAKKIGEFVDAVTNIAGQTNLLALNAAIEAARAGEQGRGFAVVAEEVRKLAEDSAGAAEQIAGLLANINKGVDGVLAEVANTDTVVRAQTGAVRETEASFQDISNGIERINREIEEVSAAAEEMAASAEEMVKAAESIAAISQQSAAGTEEVSASAEEQTATIDAIAQSARSLAQLAEELNGAVQQFKI